MFYEATNDEALCKVSCLLILYNWFDKFYSMHMSNKNFILI